MWHYQTLKDVGYCTIWCFLTSTSSAVDQLQPPFVAHRRLRCVIHCRRLNCRLLLPVSSKNVFLLHFWFVCVALGFTDLVFQTHHCLVTKIHRKRRSFFTIVTHHWTKWMWLLEWGSNKFDESCCDCCHIGTFGFCSMCAEWWLVCLSTNGQPLRWKTIASPGDHRCCKSSRFFTEWLRFTLEPRQKSSFMASVHTRDQKGMTFGLVLICLNSETGVEYKKQLGPKALTALVKWLKIQSFVLNLKRELRWP